MRDRHPPPHPHHRFSRPIRHHARLPSPPPCSSGTSSLSQPISLDFGPSMQNLPNADWHIRRPPSPPRHHLPHHHPGGQYAQFRHHFKQGDPIDLDALIGGAGMDDFSRDRIVFSSSEDLTTSDSEICRFGGTAGTAAAAERRRMVGMETTRRFGKFPSLSTIYPDNSSLSMDHFEQMMGATSREKITTARRKGHGDDDDARRMLGRRQFQLAGSDSEAENGRRRRGAGGGGGGNGRMPLLLDGRMPPASQSAPRTPQRRIPALDMVEEISPVLPRPDPDEDFDVPPLPRPLQLSRGGGGVGGGGEWRPLQTSTLTNFNAIMPKTSAMLQNNNNRNGAAKTANLPRMPQMDPPRSLFDPFFPQQCSTAPLAARPEQFNLPSALANSFGIRGILFIQVAISGPSLLLVHVRNAALFLKQAPASCYVKVEIRRSPSNRKRTKYDHRFRCKQTIEVRESNWPEFFDDFQFKVSPVHLKYGDKLGLALYATQSAISPAAELLGRMSFSLRKFFRLAKQQQWEDGGQQEPVQVCEGGFFLLPDRLGQQSHLSQDNILHRKYYDEIGGGGGGGVGACSSLSSTSSFGSSPFKMMSEPEWPTMAPTLGRPIQFLGATTNLDGGGQKGANGQAGKGGGGGMGGRLLDSSQSSSSQSGVDCKRRAAPFPSVTTDTTTSDFTSSAMTFSSTGGQMAMATDSFSSGGAEVGGKVELQLPSGAANRPQQQRAKSQPNEAPQTSPKRTTGHQVKMAEQPACPASSSGSQNRLNAVAADQAANAVRRVASFTHSPNLLVNPQLYKKRNSVTAGTAMTDKMPRKNAGLGPLGKTLHFLKSKLDFSLSASILCPSKEDCRLWQESFEALLNHKYGCMLFRDFLQKEFSDENLEFWLECEEFKRMKEAKKQAMQKKAQHIYNAYIKELAPKEVNLDSETRMKTKAGLERVPLRPDALQMAQNKIEQLMAKDSYPRFLKSEQYLELLSEREAAERSGANNNSLANGLLRVASAKEGGTKKAAKGGNSRSPSLSPILSNNSRWGRRNTCSPTSPATLQIPSAILE